MMEKTANCEFIIYKENGETVMRLPGGEIKKYDGRFGKCELGDGENRIFFNKE